MKISAKLIVVMLGLLAGAAGAVTFPFVANGSWTVPAGVTSITIEVWGGGGGGGGNTTTSDGGGGGGGGAYSRTANIPVTVGEVCTVTVGTGGAGGALLTLWAGAAGGQTSVSCNGGASVSAAGGAGGLPPVAGAGGVGGAGGAVGGGVISFSGGNGGRGRNSGTGRGGPGGSSAGTTANGVSGAATWVTLTAAPPPVGGGIGGNGGNSGQNGFAPASGNGGGGGGSGDRTTTNRTGGNGAGGKAVISYATAPIVTTTAATALLSDGATLNGTVDDGGADTTITFEYGLTTAYGNTVAATPSPLPANSGSTLVSAAVSGLACNTTYHFRAAGVNSAGASYGGDLTFTTPACPPADFVFTDNICSDGVPFGPPPQPCNLVTWSPRTAGQVLSNIYLTRVALVGGNLVPTRVATSVRTRTMQFGLSCHDPVADAGVAATLTYLSPAPTVVTLPLCQGGGASPAPANRSAALSVTFDAGIPSSQFPFSFNYDDVGQVDLWVFRSASTQLGYTGSFVVKPAGFALSDIRQTAAPNQVNPAAADAAGLKFVKAGEAFSATVTALTLSGKVKADAGTAVNCAATPADCTPNYGKETSPESVRLISALVAGLGLTNNPAPSGSFGSFGSDCTGTVDPAWNGRTCGTAFTWHEVGIITLTPGVGDLDYLAAGDVIGTTTGNVGRFSLGKLALQNVALVNRADYCDGGFGVTLCTPAFTYMGEQIDAEFTLRPQSLNGTPVLNYVDSAIAANDFAKSDPTTFADLNLAAVDRTTAGGPYYLSARISNTAMPAVSCTTTPCFQAASANVTAPFAFSRDVAPDGVYSAVEIGIDLTDSDGARVEGAGATPGLCNNPNATDCYDLDSDAVAGNDRARLGATEFRYGRIKVSNAYGSELLPLTLVATAQHYTVNGWVNSTTDTVTDLNVAASYAVGAGSSSTTVTPVSGILDAGSLNILLAKPSGGATGVATVEPTVVGCAAPATCYLPVTAGTATFGVYKSNNKFIYRREAY